jgi:phosphatidate cytidylyltransferase
MSSNDLNWAMAGVVVGMLTLGTLVGWILQRKQVELGLNRAAVTSFNGRLRAWWIMCCLLAVAFWRDWPTVLLFGAVSFWALREYITLTPTRLGDHRALGWMFYVFAPLHYVLVAFDQYALYSILIPVYGFLFIPLRVAIAGDTKRFLERVAKIQSGLLICVYCLGFAPALLYLKDIAGIEYSDCSRLLFFFVVMAIIAESLQFFWDKLYGQHLVAPEINSTRTWEGVIAGAVMTAIIGAAFHIFTPYREVWHTLLVCLLIAIMVFAGSMTMSAIKRDRGVRDYGTLVEGHSGVLDRIDGICFAAPVFYHVTRHFLLTAV